MKRSVLPSRLVVSLGLLAALALAGCGEDKKADPKTSGSAGSAGANASGSGESATAKAPPKPVAPRAPDVLVDDAGAYIGGERVEFKSPDAEKKMAEIMGKHASIMATTPMTVVAMRNAKTPDVVKTVTAISGKAESVSIRTQNRDKKDTTIKVLTDDKAGKLPDCTLAAMVLKDRATASWHIRGGVAQKYNKGMAGPDMSQTAEGMAKQWKTCPAGTMLVVSGDDSTEWGLVFDITQMADPRPASPTNTYIIPRTTPIAGRAVKIGDLLAERARWQLLGPEKSHLTLRYIGANAARDTTGPPRSVRPGRISAPERRRPSDGEEEDRKKGSPERPIVQRPCGGRTGLHELRFVGQRCASGHAREPSARAQLRGPGRAPAGGEGHGARLGPAHPGRSAQRSSQHRARREGHRRGRRARFR